MEAKYTMLNRNKKPMITTSSSPLPTKSGIETFEPSILEKMWSRKNDLIRTLIVSLTFLLALSLHWLVTENITEKFHVAYPCIILFTIWIARSMI